MRPNELKVYVARLKVGAMKARGEQTQEAKFSSSANGKQLAPFGVLPSASDRTHSKGRKRPNTESEHHVYLHFLLKFTH